MTEGRPLFMVTASRRQPEVITPFVLMRSNWDDFGFKTTYVLKTAADGDMVGNLKILKRGQGETAAGVIPDGPRAALGDEFCSLGQDLDFYERIAAMPENTRTTLLAGLRDAVADPVHARSFSKEKGWKTSLCRYIEDEGDFVKLAGVLLSRDYTALPSLFADISFQPAGWDAPLTIPAAHEDEELFPARRFGIVAVRNRLPRRMTVLTGRNGSGKSTLLARLARVIHASQAERATPELRALGTIVPAGIGFTRVVTVSYSAFDAFELPGIDEDERRRIAKDVSLGEGRYVFCGLRDVAREAKADLDAVERAGLGRDRSVGDRRPDNLLKSIAELADEFERLVATLRRDGRETTFEQAVSPVLADASFNDLEERTLDELLGDSPRDAFLAWSTGHKIALHLLASLTACVETRSMVLIDEPETHLHPPLLAALMHGINYLLEERDAFAVCVTHSPVVAQETLANHMRIVRRDGPITTITEPRIETFGESIGAITDEIFGLDAGVTGFHAVLRYLLRSSGTVENVEATFDRGLSLQARAYLMTVAAKAPKD